jgi:cytochrome c553
VRFILAVLALLGATAALAAPPPALAAPPDTIAQRVVACAPCHGNEGRATNEGFYPRIAGKPQGYLYNQLLNFRDGRRRNAAMAYLVAHQSDAYLAEIATYFATQQLPYPPPRAGNATPAELERGRQLAEQGDKARAIPACMACHGNALTGVLPATPGLLGLPRDYLSAQIGAWKAGTRRAAAPDCMAQIVRALGPEDVGAVSAWLASRPVPANAEAVAKAANEPPLACGTIPAPGRP